MADPDDGRAYRGLPGAFPYAFRSSESRLFRSYVGASALVGLLVSFLLGSALVVLVANTLGTAGGSLTLSRSFYLLVGILVVAPLVAPVLLVARRHRRGGSSARYDRALAAAGFLFVLSLYLGLVASMPETFVLDGEPVARPAPSGLFAPVVALLYAIPPAASPVVPAAAAALIGLAHRRYR